MINKVILVSFVGTLYNIVKTLGVDAPEYKSFYNYLFEVLNRTFPNPNPNPVLNPNNPGNVQLSRRLNDILNNWGGDITSKELSIGLSEGKLSAVKEYKNRTGHNLMESKRHIERVFSELGLVFSAYSDHHDVV